MVNASHVIVTLRCLRRRPFCRILLPSRKEEWLMRILVDMDDVLELLVPGWVAYINDRFGTSASPADVRDWNMAMAFPTLTHEQVYSAVMDDALWDYVQPMPGADEALRKLMAQGHEIWVVTATHYATLRAKMEKVLFRYFPYLDWHHVIITENKHMILGDILIDDGPHNLTGGCYRKILFTAGHNLDFDETSVGAVRVQNWQEAYEQVQRIAAEM